VRQWYVSASLTVGTDFDTPNTVPVGGRVMAGVRLYPLFSAEIKGAYMVGRQIDEGIQDLTLWSLMVRGLVHPSKKGSAKSFYFVLGLGVLSANQDVSPGFEVGGGYALPLWEHIDLVVEITYVMDVTEPRFDAVISSVGARWNF
jgi:hypothetical protein